MLQINEDNKFSLHGTVVREPKVYYNRDGSMKVAMTLRVEDEYPRPDGGKSFQFIPIETFYGRKYVSIHGDGVKDAVKKNDVVTAQGRLEVHRWNAGSGEQSKLVLFCLDTPVVYDPGVPDFEDSLPFTLYDDTAQDPTPGSQQRPVPAAHATTATDAAPAPAAMPVPAAAPAGTPAAGSGAASQLPGPATTLPFTLHEGPAPGPAPETPPAPRAGTPAVDQLPGPATSLPFTLHESPAPGRDAGPDGLAVQAAVRGAAKAMERLPVPAGPMPAAFRGSPAAPTAPAPGIRQLPGPADSLPFALHGGLPPEPAPEPDDAPMAPGAAQLPGPATSLPFALHDGLPRTWPVSIVDGAGTAEAAAVLTAPDAGAMAIRQPEPVVPARSAVTGASMPVSAASGIRAADGPASWTVREHVRTLKSGRQVTVKGHAAKRRAHAGGGDA